MKRALRKINTIKIKNTEIMLGVGQRVKNVNVTLLPLTAKYNLAYTALE
jgi:hypothetical protein